MEVVLDDNGLKEFINADVPKPTDAAQVGDWQKKTTNCRRIILEGMRIILCPTSMERILHI